MATENSRAVLTIDLGALSENYRRLRAAAPGSEVAGVVKANAYGLGLAPVVDALRAAGCRSFFVAQLEEGLELRGRLADAVVYVLHGLATGREHRFVEARLIPVLNQPGELARYAALARAREERLPAACRSTPGCAASASPAPRSRPSTPISWRRSICGW